MYYYHYDSQIIETILNSKQTLLNSFCISANILVCMFCMLLKTKAEHYLVEYNLE